MRQNSGEYETRGRHIIQMSLVGYPIKEKRRIQAIQGSEGVHSTIMRYIAFMIPVIDLSRPINLKQRRLTG